MKLLFECRLDADAETLFRFHADPDNLVRLLACWPTFRMLGHDGRVEVGARLRVAERFAGFWWPLTFEFGVYEPPRRFAERQVMGLFARYEHEHEFVPDGQGTWMRDRVDVALPWWLGGEPATRLAVARRLRRFFAYRHEALADLIAGGTLL